MKKRILLRESVYLTVLDGMKIYEIIEYFENLALTLDKRGMIDAIYSFESYYDSSEVDSEFILNREETDEEYSERLINEQKQFETFNKNVEAKEIAELKRLKEKYEK